MSISTKFQDFKKLFISISKFVHKYEVRLGTATQTLMTGKPRLDIDGANIVVKKNHKCILGWYELSFPKQPKIVLNRMRKIISKFWENPMLINLIINAIYTDENKLKIYKKNMLPW